MSLHSLPHKHNTANRFMIDEWANNRLHQHTRQSSKRESPVFWLVNYRWTTADCICEESHDHWIWYKYCLKTTENWRRQRLFMFIMAYYLLYFSSRWAITCAEHNRLHRILFPIMQFPLWQINCSLHLFLNSLCHQKLVISYKKSNYINYNLLNKMVILHFNPLAELTPWEHVTIYSIIYLFIFLQEFAILMSYMLI